MEAVALFSFPAAAADELSFQEGDILKVSAASFLGSPDLAKFCVIARLCVLCS